MSSVSFSDASAREVPPQVLHDIANYANTWIHLWPVFTGVEINP